MSNSSGQSYGRQTLPIELIDNVFNTHKKSIMPQIIDGIKINGQVALIGNWMISAHCNLVRIYDLIKNEYVHHFDENEINGIFYTLFNEEYVLMINTNYDGHHEFMLFNIKLFKENRDNCRLIPLHIRELSPLILHEKYLYFMSYHFGQNWCVDVRVIQLDNEKSYILIPAIKNILLVNMSYDQKSKSLNLFTFEYRKSDNDSKNIVFTDPADEINDTVNRYDKPNAIKNLHLCIYSIDQDELTRQIELVNNQTKPTDITEIIDPEIDRNKIFKIKYSQSIQSLQHPTIPEPIKYDVIIPLCISPNGRYVAFSGNLDSLKKCYIADMKNGIIAAFINHENDELPAGIIKPKICRTSLQNYHFIYISDNGGKLNIYSIELNKNICTLSPPEPMKNSIFCYKVSNDKKTLATTMSDRTIVIWPLGDLLG